jgi:hypothetical protein
MKRIFSVVFCVAAFGLSVRAQVSQPPTPPQPAGKQIVTAAQVNGIYRLDKNEFRILALGHNKLQVQFDGIYPTPKSFNLGYAGGYAIIDGNIATFKPDDTEPCEITIVFLPGKIKVTQDGRDVDCGFGHNVNATGTYRKIRGGRPKFQSPP